MTDFQKSELQVYQHHFGNTPFLFLIPTPFWKYSFSFSVGSARRKEREKAALRSRSNVVLSRKAKEQTHRKPSCKMSLVFVELSAPSSVLLLKSSGLRPTKEMMQSL